MVTLVARHDPRPGSGGRGCGLTHARSTDLCTPMDRASVDMRPQEGHRLPSSTSRPAKRLLIGLWSAIALFFAAPATLLTLFAAFALALCRTLLSAMCCYMGKPVAERRFSCGS